MGFGINDLYKFRCWSALSMACGGKERETENNNNESIVKSEKGRKRRRWWGGEGRGGFNTV